MTTILVLLVLGDIALTAYAHFKHETAAEVLKAALDDIEARLPK